MHYPSSVFNHLIMQLRAAISVLLPLQLSSMHPSTTTASRCTCLCVLPLSFAVQWTFWAAFGTSLGLVLLLSFWEQARRQHPLNLVFLFAFTAAEAVLVGTISSMYNTDVVLIAALLTVGMTACLSLYATQTKRDFTAAGGIMFSLLFALIGAGLLSIFIRNRVMDIVVSGVGAALFGAYIVFDVQLMVGSGAYAISPDEYVMAAINIYLDIVNLFLYLLRLLQEIQGNN
eukprot:GHRQ01035325.1.p1 GENE.GHRQ01035325.1~~GHRQ01035325.1.p1  ORF type:complete len:230 (-),score=87.82 GHRQ01035325.1:3-692(-)